MDCRTCVYQPIQPAMPSTKKKSANEDPCWDGYKQEGMKEKNGKKVPNCVPEKQGSSKKG